jgi:hypothetical protein
VTWLVRRSAVAGLVGLAGCGGTHARLPLGASVFDTGCRTCHSLIGNESLARVGGDLLGYRLTRTEMIEFVREMPVRHPLSQTQILAVSDYVLGLERRPSPACQPAAC